jgi:hypothetical protein
MQLHGYVASHKLQVSTSPGRSWGGIGSVRPAATVGFCMRPLTPAPAWRMGAAEPWPNLRLSRRLSGHHTVRYTVSGFQIRQLATLPANAQPSSLLTSPAVSAVGRRSNCSRRRLTLTRPLSANATPRFAAPKPILLLPRLLPQRRCICTVSVDIGLQGQLLTCDPAVPAAWRGSRGQFDTLIR